MAYFLCIRHAQSELNAAGLWQGQADPPLSNEGIRQAHALAAMLSREPFAQLAALVSSDLQRASQTAAILGEALGLAPERHEGLREMDVGRWSGRSHAEISARWPEEYARFRAGDENLRPGGGESRGMLRERALQAFREVSARWRGRELGVVTHLGVLRVVQPGLELANAGVLRLPTCVADWPAASRGAPHTRVGAL